MRVVIICPDHPAFARRLAELLAIVPDVGDVVVAAGPVRSDVTDILVVSGRSVIAGEAPDPRSARFAVVIVPAAGPAQRLALFAAGYDEVLHGDISVVEIVARIRAFGRRSRLVATAAETTRPFLPGPDVPRGPGCDTPVGLTDVEARLLAALMAEPGRTVPAAELLRAVWGSTAVAPSTISACIRRLRQKVEANPSHPAFIRTTRGVGYRYDPGASCAPPLPGSPR
jgi:hypothetical protein